MKILVVDDEDVVRRSLVRAAQVRDHQVKEARDGEEGLKVWGEFKPDLVFLDILMPGLSGPQVLKELSQDMTEAKVILISAYSGEFDAKNTLSHGADLFVQKPFPDIFKVIEQGEELVRG